MSNPAQIGDLEAGFYRPLADSEKLAAQTWLDRAYRKLLSVRPNLESDVTAGTVLRERVVDVVCAMAGRVLSNPEGKKSEGIDDYTYARADSLADGLLYVRPDELADLTPSGTHKSIRLVVYGDYGSRA